MTFPAGTANEVDLLLSWLAFLRGAVLRKATGITDEQARWRPDGKLISLLGIVNHLTHVEWRWIDGQMQGHKTSKTDQEYDPSSVSIESVLESYRARAALTDGYVRRTGDLTTATRARDGTDLRFVLLHLINETARHAGHADAVRELLDGTTGE